MVTPRGSRLHQIIPTPCSLTCNQWLLTMFNDRTIVPQFYETLKNAWIHWYSAAFVQLLEWVTRVKMSSLTRRSRKHWNTEKNAWVWHPYFLIKYTPRITKIPIWKHSMCILARNFDIYVLKNNMNLTEKGAFSAFISHFL